MRHIAMQVAYDGSAFCGSQRQANGRTVQGEIERALEALLGGFVPLQLAGRTDAGVHATGQVAKWSAPCPIPIQRISDALNCHLDKAVRVQRAWEVESDFHPRFSAKSRTYIYRIHRARVGNPLIQLFCATMRDELDAFAMREAAQAFVGTHDFAAWQNAGSPASGTIREVKRLEIRKASALGCELLEIEIEANAFLYHMVRNIVGALIVAGRGQLTKSEILALTAARDRTKCPKPAPPQGLCLVEVKY